MKRREMLISCGLMPFVTDKCDDIRVVKFSSYECPEKNMICHNWAESYLSLFGGMRERLPMHFGYIERLRADGCYLLESNSCIFTSKEKSGYGWHGWHGDVKLVRDIWNYKDGKKVVQYYICCTDNSKRNIL